MKFRMTSTLFMIGILSFALSGCDGMPVRKDPNPFHLPPEGFVGDSTKGKILFTQNCLSCHGIRGRGTNQGPPLVHKTYNPRHHADMAFNLAVKNGVRSHHWKFGDMKPMPDVSPEDVGHITSYVREMQRNAGIK